jgi:heme-degrading monooxygenase HmoA
VFAIIWQYAVPVDRVTDFVRAYSSDGDWAQLFRAAPGYAGTELIRCDDGRFMTIDRWQNKAAFEQFLVRHRDEYDALDARLAAFTSNELLVGRGDVADERPGTEPHER